MSLLGAGYRPKKKFMMLDDFSFGVVGRALKRSSAGFYLKTSRAMHNKNIYSLRMYLEEAAYFKKLLHKLKEKEFYFMGTLTKREKKMLKDSLADYGGELRDCAVDYKLGLETERNKQSFNAYIVLDKLMEGIKIC